MRRPTLEVSGLVGRMTAPVPTITRWTALCAAAGAVGIAAATVVERLTQTLDDRGDLWGTTGFVLILVVAGGLIGGAVLGSAQGWALGRWLPALRRRRFVLATVLVAGLGWAAASLPAALAPDGDGPTPPLPWLVLGAAGLGLGMGTLLGAAQAAALRWAVPHPWRWAAANAAAWPAAMVVIVGGTTSVGVEPSMTQVLLTGLATGAVAGALLGVVSGWFLPSLDGASPSDRVFLALLGSTWRGPWSRSLIGLEVHGRRTDRTYRFPVQYAADHDGLVVVPARAVRKTWWTNLTALGTHVEVLWEGAWHPGRSYLLRPGDPGYDGARATYERRFERLDLPPDQPIVRIRDAALGNP